MPTEMPDPPDYFEIVRGLTDDPEVLKALDAAEKMYLCRGADLGTRKHRMGENHLPQGPNEDVGQCPYCWAMMPVLRPDGETYGEHTVDCSLPRRHPGYCKPGGQGHPSAEHIRGS